MKRTKHVPLRVYLFLHSDVKSLQIWNHIWSKICLQGSLWPTNYGLIHMSRTWAPNSAILDAANRWRLLAQVTRDKIFFRICNIFLDLATILGFVNFFGIYKIIFVDSIILLRFVIVFQIWSTLQRWFPKNITTWNIFSDFGNIFRIS